MIKLDARKLTDALVRLEGTCDELPQLAEQVRQEALGHAILGANANIYGTAPGTYQRTQDYLRGLNATAQASKNRATVTVSNASKHAAYVEFGRSGLPAAALQALALGRPDPAAPLSLGRSGLNWWVAGPVVTGAQVYAAHRLGALFLKSALSAARR